MSTGLLVWNGQVWSCSAAVDQARADDAAEEASLLGPPVSLPVQRLGSSGFEASGRDERIRASIYEREHVDRLADTAAVVVT